MFRIIVITLLVSMALITAEPRVHQSRGLALNQHSMNANNPYIFLSVPRGRSSAVVHGFEVLDADGDADADDDKMIGYIDDDDIDESLGNEDQIHNDYDSHRISENDNEEEVELNYSDKNNFSNLKSILKNVKPTQMAVAKEHAGAIMVPDGVIEIEGQSVVDEKTGQEALLVPRSALNAIPDGSVVALIERSLDEPVEQERANRVYVRRRRKGARKNIRRGFNKRRRSGNKNRRLTAKRKNVRVIQTGGKNRRRRVNNSIRPIRIQG